MRDKTAHDIRHYSPNPDIGLFGGRWVHDPKTHVLRWVQERQPAPMPNEPILPLCKWCTEPFDRPRCLYCSDDCFKAARAESKRQSAIKKGRAKGKCVDCGGSTYERQNIRCKPCALTYRVNGKWVGPEGVAA